LVDSDNDLSIVSSVSLDPQQNKRMLLRRVDFDDSNDGW